MRLPGRRAALTGLASLVALAMVVTGQRLALRGEDVPDQLSVLPDPTSSAPASPSTGPRPSATPSRSPSARPIAAAADGSGDGAGTDSGSADYGSFGPAYPGSVTVRHFAGQHTWSGTSNGFRIAVSMSPATVRTGEWATFTMRISGDVAYCCDGYMVFGNGLTTGGSSCDRDQSGGATFTWRTMYNKARSYPLLMQATSSACGDDTGVLLGTVDVGRGSTSSNGPERADVLLSYFDSSMPHDMRLRVAATAEEHDGHIYKLRLDWGDGTVQSFSGDSSPCQLAPGGWPVNSSAQLPNDPAPTHTYAKAGTYHLVLTVYSRGCDGEDVQTTVSRMDHEAGYPPPPPDATPSPTASPTPAPTPT